MLFTKLVSTSSSFDSIGMQTQENPPTSLG
jgi:hypothetical protein